MWTDSAWRAAALAVVVFAIPLASGCAGHLAQARQRNTVEAIRVENRGEGIALENIRYVLELTHARHVVDHGGLDAFFDSDAASDVRFGIRSEVLDKARRVEATVPEAASAGGVVIFARGDAQDARPVVYVQSRRGYVLYFSPHEIDKMFRFAQAEMYDDLETINFVHPDHVPEVLATLRAELERRNIRMRHARLSGKDREALKVRTAAGILERQLRGMGVPLPPDRPLLESGLRGRWRSPKLTAAFRDAALIDRVAHGGQPAVARAFAYLVEEKVIRLPGAR